MFLLIHNSRLCSSLLKMKQINLSFIRDKCCHLKLCLHLVEPNWLATFSPPLCLDWFLGYFIPLFNLGFHFCSLKILVHWFQIFQSHSRAVNEAFVELFDSGLIYRGNFLVNWSTKLQSAISDIEVDHVEVTKKTKLTVPGMEKPVEVGLIYDVAYKIFDVKGKNPLSSYSFGGIRTADLFLCF